MRLFNILLNISLLSLFFNSCESVVQPNGTSNLSGDWLIPRDQIYDGGPGKDGIPALTNPSFISLSGANYLSNSDLVLIYKQGSEVRAYPHPILDWHEIINDDINGTKVAVSYCPLTGSGIGYGGQVNSNGSDQNTTFGVSGLLYNSNLILYDRLTESNWSQMKIQCVNGSLVGQEPEFIYLIETKFSTLEALYPEAKVVSNQTGVYRSSNYNSYPYGDYRTNHNNLIFPVTPDDRKLPRKERVLGIIGETDNKVYQFKHFNTEISVINDILGNDPVVIAGSKDLNFIVAFKRIDENGQAIDLLPVQNSLPVIMTDNDGNRYDIFGEIVEGSRQGDRLAPTKSFIAYWYSFGAFYPGIEIY